MMRGIRRCGGLRIVAGGGNIGANTPASIRDPVLRDDGVAAGAEGSWAGSDAQAVTFQVEFASEGVKSGGQRGSFLLDEHPVARFTLEDVDLTRITAMVPCRRC